MKTALNSVATTAALLFFGAVASASANVVVIGSSADTTIYANNVNNSSGGAAVMFSGTDGNASVKRALVEFDLSSSVPAGSTITDIQLTLFLGQVAGNLTNTTATIGLHRLTADWGEGTNGAGTPISGGGQGFPALEGDATWANRFFSSNSPVPWVNAGGDFISASSAETIVGAATNSGYTWISTSALVTDVQGWVDDPSSNFGWLLQNNDEVSIRTFRAFYTREETNSSLQPQLQITFAPPGTTAHFKHASAGWRAASYHGDKFSGWTNELPSGFYEPLFSSILVVDTDQRGYEQFHGVHRVEFNERAGPVLPVGRIAPTVK